MAEEQRVERGQRLSSALKAPTINALLDVARAYRLDKLGPQGGDSPDASLDGGLTVLVKNDTGDFADSADVLAITGAAIDFEEAPLEFAGRPVLTGDVPTSPSNLVAVLRDGLEDGEIGVGVIVGLAAVTLNVVSLSDTCAAPIPGDSAKMQSGSAGHPIVDTATRQAGTATTGEQEAVVLLVPGCTQKNGAAGCPCAFDPNVDYCVTFTNVSGCPSMDGLELTLRWDNWPGTGAPAWPYGWLPGTFPRTAVYLYCVDSSGFQLRTLLEYDSDGGGIGYTQGSRASGYASSYTCDPLSVSWGAFGCLLPGGGTLTATLATGACTGSGTGIGGSCSPSRSVLTATGNGGSGAGPYTISGVTVGGPAVLLLSVATIATVASGGSVVSGVTYNGVAMSANVSAGTDVGAIAHVNVIQWYLYVVAPTTADIVITYGGSAEVLVVATEVLALTNHTSDKTSSASSSLGGTPSTGTTATTAVACEYAAAAVVSVGPTGSPVYAGGFTDTGSTVAAGAWGATIRLYAGYKVLTSTQTVQATMTGGTTGYAALVETYS